MQASTHPPFRQIFLRVSWTDRTLAAVSQAELVNDLNDGLVWVILPVLLVEHGVCHRRRKPLVYRGACWQSCRVIELHALAPADWQIWRELRLAALAESPAAFGSRLADWQSADEERWRERLAILGSVNFVALLDGRPAGMASGVPGDDGVPELISMWVSPAARGKGVGDRLVESVAQWARQQGATALRLAVVEDNEKATALYRRNGFADTEELAGPLPDSIRMEKVMVKQLRPQTSAT